MSKKYEYRIVETLKSKWGTFAADENESMLTGLGLEGWRLIKINMIGTKLYFFVEREIEL